MTAFTSDNSDFTATEIEALNVAHGRLMAIRTNADTSAEDFREISKSVSDALNDAWVEGITVDELVAAVQGV